MGFAAPRHEREPTPWGDPAPARAAVFATLGVSGPDPSVDGIFRIEAARRRTDGSGWERFSRFCDPFPGSALGAATARMAREHGVRSQDLEGAPPAAAVAGELARFLGAGPVLVDDGDGFRAWARHLGLPLVAASVLGVDEAASLLEPGLRRPPEPLPDPLDVQRALAQVVGRFLERDAAAREIALAGWSRALRELASADPDLARRLALVLALAEHPQAWAASDELFALHPALAPGRLSACGADGVAAERLAELVELARPRCAVAFGAYLDLETVPVDARGARPLDAEELARIDAVFEVHLPALIAGSERDPRACYRAGQHQVAREVARTLGAPELLLVSAPTGTGKTLAYLVPALSWSARENVRVGVSTYTRALQEQASERDVPLALRALRRAGLALEPRVALLKGRANYLCWRALRLQVPGDDEGAAAWLAWTALCLFALGDEEGDLDRFPQRMGLAEAASPRTAADCTRELEALVRACRAGSGCCTAPHDRMSCAADLARMRAERSHVVLTNHAFVLAWQTFFQHLVVDECEHLHDQAHGAFSRLLPLRALRELLERLSQPRHPASRAPLDRLARLVPRGGEAGRHLAAALRSSRAAGDALAAFERALDGFEAWREEARRGRAERDQHALLREFVLLAPQEPLAAALLGRFVALREALAQLDGSLAELATWLDTVPARGMARQRRALERQRADLVEACEALGAWIPLEQGLPSFRPETFHDLEQDARGGRVLAARVLLPAEHLGRSFHPQLGSGVLISATTWLRGGFESALGYLGLDRAAAPAPGEERAPCSVRTFRAPDPFDYGRVLVCVPRDAPGYGDGREAFLAYVRRFVAHLGERTRGRMLVLFTNADDARRTGRELEGFFRARRIPLWFQGMPGVRKEELAELFRRRVDSVLLGLDTFWYGADFPGETLEYLVLVKLPYGVPDRYHHAQCAALGAAEQRRRIYLPRALAKFRQGFGRLMRRESDHGCVFVLDARILQGAHRVFLEELPLADRGDPDAEWRAEGARLVVDDADGCVRAALAHMGMLADLRRRGLEAELGPEEPPPGPGRVHEEAPAWLPGERLESE